MATDTARCVNFAVGVRKRLQQDAKRVGWSVSIPRYALVGAVHAMLGPDALEALPAQHGRKPRVLCSACQKMRPATLHWSEACLGEQPATTMQTLALNFASLAHARAFRDAVDKYVKQCTKAKSKERVQLLPFFAVKLTSSDGVAVAAKVTALFNKTRSRAKGRHVGETVPETLSTLFGGSSPRGAPVRAAFLSLVGAAKLSAAVAFLNLPSSAVTTYMPANLNHSSTVLTTIVSALYKREFPCPPRRHDEVAHLAALPAMAAMAAALASDCTAFVPLPGFRALFAALHGRAPTDGERAVARGVGDGVSPVLFREAVPPGLPLLHERRATGSLGRAVDGRVGDVRPLA